MGQTIQQMRQNALTQLTRDAAKRGDAGASTQMMTDIINNVDIGMPSRVLGMYRDRYNSMNDAALQYLQSADESMTALRKKQEADAAAAAARRRGGGGGGNGSSYLAPAPPMVDPWQALLDSLKPPVYNPYAGGKPNPNAGGFTTVGRRPTQGAY